MPVTRPAADTRWRCTPCGNLTRFDVTSAVRSQDYVHVDLAGRQVVEERTVLEESVEHVACRWCGAIDQVELISRPDA